LEQALLQEITMSEWATQKKRLKVKDYWMAYVERGEGDPIVFLHGNPTSSFLWRDVMPELEGQGRCVAPDLIGMGDSDKLRNSGPESYLFVEHRAYLDEFLAALGIAQNVTLVIHDWGSALGFDWAHRNPGAINGIAYMEAIVRPLRMDEFPKTVRPVFEAFRSAKGEEMVLQHNVFVQQVLPGAIMRKLSEEEMAEYRRPFTNPGEDRRPTLTWPRQIPFDGEPADVTEIVHNYSSWMSSNTIPKLFINAAPGAILRGPVAEHCRAWPNQTEVTVPGTHFIQEDSGKEIGQAVSAWLAEL